MLRKKQIKYFAVTTGRTNNMKAAENERIDITARLYHSLHNTKSKEKKGAKKQITVYNKSLRQILVIKIEF